MSQKRLYSLRGATSCQNTKASIQEATEQLLKAMFEKNAILVQDIVHIHFTLTKDLTALNPATALRAAHLGVDVSSVPLFCSQEAEIDGMVPHIIRVMLTAYFEEGTHLVPVYQNEARRLRPDLVS